MPVIHCSYQSCVAQISELTVILQRSIIFDVEMREFTIPVLLLMKTKNRILLTQIK